MKTQTTAPARLAFTLLELLSVAVVLLVVMTFVIPALQPNRHGKGYSRIRCVNHLKNVGLAFRIFATDNEDRFPFEISSTNGGTRELHANGDPFYAFLAVSNELSTPNIVVCPNDTRKEAASWTNFSNGNVSYFLNTNAVESNPTAFLAGDRNIEHNAKPIPTGRFEVPAGTSIQFDNRIHKFAGNVCIADGSVRQLSNAQILAQTNHTGYVLAVP